MGTVYEVNFAAVRNARERLIIAVAGLIDANHPYTSNAEGVATFAYETLWHLDNRGVDFYADMLLYLRADHADALKWATDRLSSIPGWRGALFGTGEAAR
jgi:hypothetical protein